jgi:hypothetical protein
MKRTFPTIAAVAVLASLSAHAQQKLDFSGTWVMDVARSESQPRTLFIEQKDGELRVVETERGAETVFARYPLNDSGDPRPVGTSGTRVPDGEPVGTTDTRVPDGEPVGTSGTRVAIGQIVQWAGDTLVTITPYLVNGMTVTTEERRSLSRDGQQMKVVRTLQIHHGSYASSKPATDVYRRVHR